MPKDATQLAQEFDFTAWRVHPRLRRAFAAAFTERTRPGGPVRTAASAYKTFRTLRSFADYLGDLTTPPRRLRGTRRGTRLALRTLTITLPRVTAPTWSPSRPPPP
ncbi:hypothetical protein ACFZBU_42015 [Embleya sp. NPDC008237]|uniref:hypothetical protein n=1 Tax=Embleya sp. NPDC008237 TaxID=3363978 RepID=UPI0036E6E94E